MERENNPNAADRGEINPPGNNPEGGDQIANTPSESANNSGSIARSELVLMLSGYLNKVITNSVVRIMVAKTILVTAIVLSLVFIFSFFVYLVPAFQEIGKSRTGFSNNIELKNDQEYKKKIAALNRDVQRLTRKFTSFTPGQSYLVINTTDNSFTLYRNKKPVREGLCSSGSYTLLSTAEGNRQWIFKTPKGQFWIQQKIVKPLWIRPDWAFVEEGLPIPPANDESRFEYGVLGDYAMSLGDGYLIHGTIYTRAMGMPVTHGCVRLGDEDLEVIFNTLNIGSKVFIF